MQREADIAIFQPAATLGGDRAATLSLGYCQEPPETVCVLAQLHSVNSQAAGLRGDVQHCGGSWALG